MTQPQSTSSLPPPHHLSLAQRRELESELRRELATLDRRLASERQTESAEPRALAAHDAAAAALRASDTSERRDLLATALARLTSGEYGSCSRCGEPIPFGRLLVMPEAIHCLACSARS
jgi:DnaK suppressor protein